MMVKLRPFLCFREFVSGDSVNSRFYVLGDHISGGNLMHFLFGCVLGDFPGENFGFWVS